jgi:sulfonate transport system substrate-binding protein
MKKTLALLLTVVMSLSLLTGCGGQQETPDPSGESADSTIETSSEPLRVAVQSYYCSSMVEYIQANQLDKAAGLNIEWLVFNGGAPINEAMGEWDIAVTGGAFVYALANYNCRLVAHQVNGTDGNYVVARKGDPLTQAKTSEEMAECVRGKTLLTCFGTTGHYTLNLWLDSIGVSPDECNIMNLEIANVYSSWVAGEGDYAVLTEPYCYYDMDEMNTEIIATLESIGGELFESTVCTADAYANRYDDVVKFISILYQACDALAADEDLAVETVVNWYTNCGKALDPEDARTSIQGKPFITSAEAKEITLGEFATSYASWFESRELIDSTGLENVKANIAGDVFADALAVVK